MNHRTRTLTVGSALLIAALGLSSIQQAAGQYSLPWPGGPGGPYYVAQQPPAPADQPAPPPQPAPAYEPSPYDQLAYTDTMSGLASVPNMFGDFFGGGTVVVQDLMPQYEPWWPSSGLPEGVLSLPPAGGSRRVKISENNKALPTDRVYFLFNRFENALYAESWFGPPQTDPVNRYTFGAEKTFFDGWWSAEIRMPFVERFGYEAIDGSAIGGPVGNLAVDVKRLLYRSDNLALAMGLGVDTPTGSDVRGFLGTINYRMHNDSLHLLPWAGMLHQPTERLFHQAFIQVDVPTNGDRITSDGVSWGKLNDQTLMYIDWSIGYWLHRNPSGRFLTAVAPIFELHYTTTLQDYDVVTATDGALFYHFTQFGNRIDPLNITAGLHIELGKTVVAVGGAFPLRGRANKMFDSELQIYVNRYF